MKFYGNSNDQELRKNRATFSEADNENPDIVLLERQLNEKVNMSLSRQFFMKSYRLYHDDSNFENGDEYSRSEFRNFKIIVVYKNKI